MNETQYLLICVTEEGCEVGERACKANRFGFADIEPGYHEDNRRRLEREIADLMGTARMLGLEIREEDIVAKIEKLKKYMDYSRQLGILDGETRIEVQGMCPACKTYVPRGFYRCNGDGSHPAIREKIV